MYNCKTARNEDLKLKIKTFNTRKWKRTFPAKNELFEIDWIVFANYRFSGELDLNHQQVKDKCTLCTLYFQRSNSIVLLDGRNRENYRLKYWISAYELCAFNWCQRAVYRFVVFTEFLENFAYFQNDFKAIGEIRLPYDLRKMNAFDLPTAWTALYFNSVFL